MNVLLLKPFNKFQYTLMPPMGLGYLSKVLKQAGISVTVMDLSKEKIMSQDIIKIIEEIKPTHVGIYFSSSDYVEVISLAKVIKEYDSKIITIVGGPHVSALPEKTLKDIQEIDYGFIGEAEIGLPMFLKGKTESNKIPGLIWRNNDKAVIVNQVELVSDINSLGSPDWSAINPKSS